MMRTTVFLVGCFSSALTAAEPGSLPSGVLGKGTAWETSWFSVEGDAAGPTVLITGGVHGNEPAGSHAANQIRHWPVRRGRLIVVPRVNRLGLEADIRWLPEFRNDKTLRDLNRNFPTAKRPNPVSHLAEALWQFVNEQKPDLVVDLHEGFDFHISNSKSVGSSIIFSASEVRTKHAQAMLAAVNKTVEDENRQFELLSKSGAAAGSLVRASTDTLGIDAFILETTFKDQPVSLRARQHRTMVSSLLQQIGMLDRDCVDVLAKRSGNQINVAMYDSAGASAFGLETLTRVLGATKDISVVRVGPHDIQAGVLEQFDVALFPGGSGSKQGKAIEKAGREKIRSFVRAGGGIVGICGGAYLCSAHYDWSLHVINTAVFNKTIEIPGVGRKSMWYRGGPSPVKMEVSDTAAELLGQVGKVAVRYQNGPIISPGKDKELPEYTPLAWFRSEVVRYEPQRGTMIDTPAIVSAPFGKGRVLSVSPHPESTPGLEQMIVNGVRWAASSAEVRPLKNSPAPRKASPTGQAM
jgi:predicted deacylase